ncbi:lysine--tRNA ligase, partial [candidate division KSB1 bacterium]|nr:lysine--tRNA ligase [candidate division KSB1 bacterium]
SLRGQGAIIFLNFSDGTATFQALLKKGEVEKEHFTLFNETIDIGDFIEFKGSLFLTKRKERIINLICQ